jgi:molybdopterin-containing oxidoreductase family iron-sulfur binding subunit
MQCEQAPCEPVCPVEASVHDSEGLNAQVYNRCIGTRFCEANCPYKVRRFNFLDYADGRVWGDLDARSVTAQRNPEVTVRARGVMEKCTYCVQRISAARREAEKAGQPIADGTLQTACAVACPTEAIVFGDLADPDARVGALKQSPRHYTLLEELGTRPRTTYLAKVRDPAAGEGA